MSVSFIPIQSTFSEMTYIISSTTTNLDLQTLIGTTNYQSKINKRILINSDVTVGATSTANPAINIPSGFGGKIILMNYGSIQGAGGSASGGTGGNAISAGSSGVIIDNKGTIYAGGGGGGQGGTGGSGSYTYDCSYTACGGGSGFWCANDYDEACRNQNGSSSYCVTPNYGSGSGCCGYNDGGFCISFPIACCNCCTYYSQTCTAYTSGGAGGAGGRGQGYDGNFASGSAGSAGGTNAGTGGTGGTGGNWGATGSTGGTGSNGNYTNGSAGSTGGLAGYYIVNNGNVTWISTGTRLGRVG